MCTVTQYFLEFKRGKTFLKDEDMSELLTKGVAEVNSAMQKQRPRRI
jgi:hypothetical protein